MPRKKSKLFINNVDGFSALPLDVLYEIFSLLLPGDLLRLARTNKSIRSFILNRSNSLIWKAAYENNASERGPPGCPSYMSEPAWARVAFTTSCVVCETDLEDEEGQTSDPVWWEFGGWICSPCLKTATRTRISPAKLEALVSGITWEKVFPRVLSRGTVARPISWRYFLPHQEQLLEQLSAIDDDKERREFIQRRTEETAAIMAWAERRVREHEAAVWKKTREDARKAEREETAKLEKVAKRLIERGWGDQPWMQQGRLVEQLRSYSEIPAAQSSTKATRSSQESDDRIIARLLSDKRNLILKKRVLTFKKSPPSFSRQLVSLRPAIVPRTIDLILMPEVRTVVDPEGEGELSAVELNAKLLPLIPDLMRKWTDDALAAVCRYALECLALPETTPNVLDLAVALAKCPARECNSPRLPFHWMAKHKCGRIKGHHWSNPNQFAGVTHFSETHTAFDVEDSTDDYRAMVASVYINPPFAANTFRFARGVVAEGMKNVVRAYGLAPEAATAGEMKERDAELVNCLACRAQALRLPKALRWHVDTAPKTWLDAMRHCEVAHYKDEEAPKWVLSEE
uniref:F-box domain-containing protein n=1 Tax=Mycena chlorophos TaxID=658473 RepID=A0ABQ0L9A0_MYCCL|nr:predicted protein [Mycena chlorophos]